MMMACERVGPDLARDTAASRDPMFALAEVDGCGTVVGGSNAAHFIQCHAGWSCRGPLECDEREGQRMVAQGRACSAISELQRCPVNMTAAFI